MMCTSTKSESIIYDEIHIKSTFIGDISFIYLSKSFKTYFKNLTSKKYSHINFSEFI